MATIQPDRLSMDELKQHNIPFTAIPNDFFSCFEKFGLNHSEIFLLMFLMSLPVGKTWTIHNSVIAKKIGIGKSTVDTYMTKLKSAGLLDYTRTTFGFTEWKVTVKDFFKLSENPAVVKPAVVEPAVLENNKLLQTNKETTNSVVVDLPDYINSNSEVAKELSTLEKSLQTMALKALAFAMTGGNIKTTPEHYLKGIIKNTKNGAQLQAVDKPMDKSLTCPQRFERDQASVKQIQQAQRIEKLKKLLPEIQQKIGGAAHVIAGGEIILRAELVQLGLI
jgi:hypothetical protein